MDLSLSEFHVVWQEDSLRHTGGREQGTHLDSELTLLHSILKRLVILSLFLSRRIREWGLEVLEGCDLWLSGHFLAIAVHFGR